MSWVASSRRLAMRRFGLAQAARSGVLAFLRCRLSDAPPSLRLVEDGETFDFAPQPLVTITLASPGLQRAFLTGNIGRLGTAYVEGGLKVDGQLQDILQVGVALAERIARVPASRRLALAHVHGRHGLCIRLRLAVRGSARRLQARAEPPGPGRGSININPTRCRPWAGVWIGAAI